MNTLDRLMDQLTKRQLTVVAGKEPGMLELVGPKEEKTPEILRAVKAFKPYLIERLRLSEVGAVATTEGVEKTETKVSVALRTQDQKTEDRWGNRILARGMACIRETQELIGCAKSNHAYAEYTLAKGSQYAWVELQDSDRQYPSRFTIDHPMAWIPLSHHKFHQMFSVEASA